jgi:hypothetical protein
MGRQFTRPPAANWVNLPGFLWGLVVSLVSLKPGRGLPSRNAWAEARARLCGIVLVCLVLAVAPASAGAQAAASLYQVDVPVADQSPGARQQAARDGLAIVLSRLTGVARMPDDPRVRRALGNPDPYYVQFSYQPGAAPGQLMVRLQFSPPALFQLIRETGLPIWPSNRPAVLVWALVDQDGELRIPPAGSGDPVERAMLARALERGLVVRLATLVDPVGDPVEDPVEEVPAAPAAAALPGASAPPAAEPAVGQPAVRAPEPETDDLEPEPRAPEDVVLRPALPDGTPVWPTVGYWNAGLPELLALSQRDAGDVRVIARLHGTTGGAWAGEVEIHDPSAEPVADAEPLAGAESPAGAEPPSTPRPRPTSRPRPKPCWCLRGR